MKRKTGWDKMICWLIVPILVATAGAESNDDFSVDHNYLTEGSVSFWDGYTINEGAQDSPDAEVSVLKAANGVLTMTTANSNIEGDTDDGLMLFTTVPAGVDFVASVKVVGGNFTSLGGSEVGYNGAGLTVRGDTDFDNLLIDAFDHPSWGCTYLWTSDDDGAQTEEGLVPATNATVAQYPWQRITRVGSVYTAYLSADGVTWLQQGTAWTRDDLAGQVEVGLHHCTFTSAEGSVDFDNFSLDYGPTAYMPAPKCRQGMVTDQDNPLFEYVPTSGQILSWSAPNDPNIVTGHTITYDVYMSQGADPNIILVSDDQTETSYTPTADFPMDTTYTWYIESTFLLDDANDVTVTTSPVWSFHTIPPNVAPVALAGDDIYTWPDAGVEPDPDYITVTLSGDATDDGLPEGRTLTYEWTVSETSPTGNEELVVFSDATILNPVVTIPATTGSTYTLKLTVTEVIGTETFKSDTDEMVLRVYTNSCTAARAKSTENQILADYNYDCVLNLLDLADFAQDWLRDTNLTRPE